MKPENTLNRNNFYLLHTLGSLHLPPGAHVLKLTDEALAALPSAVINPDPKVASFELAIFRPSTTAFVIVIDYDKDGRPVGYRYLANDRLAKSTLAQTAQALDTYLDALMTYASTLDGIRYQD